MKFADLIGLNPALPDAQFSLEARFNTLKVRTSALGVIAAALFGIGVLGSVTGAQELWDAWRISAGAASAGGVELHTPAELWAGGTSGSSTVNMRASLLLPIALLAVWVLGIWGWSNGRLWGARRFAWMAVIVVLSGANFLARSSHSSFASNAGGAAGKQLSAAVAAKRWDAAEAIVTAQPDSGPRRYVQAQIALRAGDNQSLRKYAQPLIEQVDFYVMDSDPTLRGTQAQNLAFVRPPVLYALEMGLYGAPKTEVALALHKQIGQTASAKGSGSSAAGLLVNLGILAAALSAAVLGGLGLRTWHAMTRRVIRLQAWVEQPYDYGDAADER